MNRVSAILLGVLGGAGLGLLLAPRSGPETRARLRRSWDDLQGQTQERLNQGRMRVTELIRSGQERLDETTRRTTGAIAPETEPPAGGI